MQIGFSTAALFPRPTRQALELIESCGFECAELMPQCRWETTPACAKQFLQDGLTIKIQSVHFPLVFFPVFYNPYPGMQLEAKGLIDDLVQAAHILGAQVIVIHPPEKATEATEMLFYHVTIENIRYLCDRSKEANIMVVIENSPQSVCKDPDGMKTFLKEIDHPNAYPMLDTTEAMKAKISPVKFVEALDLKHIHLSDYAQGKVHLPIKEGELPWEDFFKSLQAKGYRGGLILEPAYSHFLTEKTALAKMLKMREVLEQLWKEK